MPAFVPPVDPTAERSAATRAITRLSITKAGVWFLMNVSRRVDPVLHRATRGHVSTLVVTPVILLTTTGAKSGLPRTTPLVYFTDKGRVVTMASNYGRPHNPAWYHNVKANPEVTISVQGRRARFRGEEVSGEEYERLWALAKRFAATYGTYEERSGRHIPVVTFAPVVTPTTA